MGPARSDSRPSLRATAPCDEYADAMICPQFHRLWREMLKYEGGFRVLSQQSESADNRPDTARQNGAIANQAARPSSAGEIYGAETPASRDKATSGERKHWLDYA